MTEEIMSAVNGQVFAVWFLIGAALVFWMQAGFAMVEAGFTRAKNSGNILMKNLMDFCIGCVVFILIGFSLLLGEDLMGLIGKPGFDIFTNYEGFDWSNFIFNLVFCATTATIVSGAMAERTKFLSYCIYSGVISALIYPIEAHWIWGGGWLAQMGFHDFAGSCAIHMVGGISALIGAKILGPRIGKFTKDKSGKITKVNAFPGHNLPIGALGVFILWLGWYGFNGAACTSVEQLGSVFVTTTVAPSIATVVVRKMEPSCSILVAAAPLKPYQPSHRMKHPRQPMGRLCPGKALTPVIFPALSLVNFPIRGPRIAAPIRALIPPTIWIAQEPAKSWKPSSDSQPPPQIQ